MSYDLIIKNGTVIDGTGAFRRRADVAIKDGKVAGIGKVTDGAAQTIDASDLIVSPGFVDPHTHYDAQICWDPLVSCTSWHGVTTVVMGNCGVGIAPCKPEAREIAAWDLVNVEAIPFEALSKGITWDWESFPDFMTAAARRGAGINLAFLAPLTPFRHFVMGDESMEREATPDETERIAALLREAVGAGAFGFSTTTLPQHIGYQGRPLACRLASTDELKAYANVLRDAGRGAIEIALTRRAGRMSEDEYELLEFLLDESQRPVTWLAMASRPDKPEASADTLRRLEPLIKRGGVPQVLCKPFVVQMDLRNPFSFADMELWGPVFNQPLAKQKEFYRDPEFRGAFREELKKPHLFQGKWNRVEVLETASPALKTVRAQDGRRNRRAAPGGSARHVPRPRARGRSEHPVHDAAVSRGRNSAVDHRPAHDARAVRRRRARQHAVRRGLLHLPARHLGARAAGADAGARDQAHHVGAGGLLRHQGSRTPQGRTAGRRRDLRRRNIGSAKRARMQNDLPGGGRRLVMPAEGIEYTIVNGDVLYEHGHHSGYLPGQVLRSGTQ